MFYGGSQPPSFVPAYPLTSDPAASFRPQAVMILLVQSMADRVGAVGLSAIVLIAGAALISITFMCGGVQA